jgi:hypothetical protein
MIETKSKGEFESWFLSYYLQVCVLIIAHLAVAPVLFSHT